ncbi:MAG: TAXI family TRAP transporter solute-binding subunit [Candidatus Thiothrix moscowensis]|nr:TAXI family TRAP transporter solute-binding subunit [Candidatus Thiothrix moscowensis]
MKKLNLKFQCEFCKIWLPLILLLVAGFYTAWQFVPAAASNALKIAVGGTSGSYHDYAQQYQQQVQAEGVNLEILPVAGSVEALQKVKEGEADLALVQGGVAHSTMKDAADQGLHSIASLFYEPLWVFYRKELGEVSHVNALRGKRISIGKQGSGTQVLVSQLLADNDITAENSALQPLLMDEAITKLEAGDLDAVFIMTSPKEAIVRQLITHPDIALMDFQRQVITYTSHYPFLSSLTLGEGIIDLKNNLPDHNVTLLATTATLVAGNGIHADHVRLFSREAFKIHSKQGLLEKARQFPSIDHLEIPIHPTAEQYLQKGPSWLEKVFPFWLAARIDQLKIMLIPLLTLLIPLSKGIMPLYQWRIRSRIYPWYKTLSQLDRKLDNLELTATEQEIARLHKLHGELANTVSVPLAHMSEFYNLRTHADHILTRLKERRVLLLADTIPVAPLVASTALSPQNIPEPCIEAGNECNPVEEPAPITIIPDTPDPQSPLVTEPELAVSPPTRKFRIRPFWKREPGAEPSAEETDTSTTPLEPVVETGLPPTTSVETQTRHQQHHQAQKIVRKHMLSGMALSAVPIPILDVAALTSIQLHLLDKLSQHYAVSFDKKLAKAKLIALLGSTLPTTSVMGLSSLTKLIPGIGTLAGGAGLSALSGAVIYATGSVFIRHFEAGGTLETFNHQQQFTPFRQALDSRIAKPDMKKATT